MAERKKTTGKFSLSRLVGDNGMLPAVYKGRTRQQNPSSDEQIETKQDVTHNDHDETAKNEVEKNNDNLLEQLLSKYINNIIQKRFDSSKIKFPSTHDETEPQRGFEFVPEKDTEFLNEINVSKTDDPLDSDSDQEMSCYKDEYKYFYAQETIDDEVDNNNNSVHGGDNETTTTKNNEYNESTGGEEPNATSEEEKKITSEKKLYEQEDNKNNSKENVDDKNKNIDNKIPTDFNIILNYHNLVNLFCNEFSCKKCGTTPDVNSFRHSSCGIASTLHFQCETCRSCSAVSTEKTKKEEHTSNNNQVKTKKRGLASYALNLRLVLWSQSFGIGKTAVRQLISFLGLSVHIYSFGSYGKLEEFIGLSEIELCKKIIDASIRFEMARSPTNNLCGRIMLCVTMDAGWSHRGTGKSFNSDVGHHIIIGCRTHNVIALFVMSRSCAKCDNNNEHDDDLCSRNFSGSSKSMEAYGAARNVRWLFENYNCYVQTVVMDDDSSSKCVLKTKLADQEKLAKRKASHSFGQEREKIIKLK